MKGQMREAVESLVTAWERRSKASMHLDALLHKKIKADLVDSLVAMIEADMLARAGQKPPISEQNDATGDKPTLYAVMIREAADKARPHAIKPNADGMFEVHPAKPRGTDEDQMAAFKAELKAKLPGKRGKGRAR